MTQRLVSLISGDWPRYDGWLVSRNVDPLELPLDRFLNSVYFFVIKDAPEAEIRKFDIRLWVPPAGVVPTAGPWTAEAEAQSFNALKNALSAGSKNKDAPTE